MPMQIRRDQSSLHFGRRSRRSGAWRFLLIWVMLMAIILGLIWRFNAVQAEVVALVSGPTTPTPSSVTLAQQAETAYWEGNLGRSIEFYGRAFELDPENVGVGYEYVRNLVYGSYEGRGFRFRADMAIDVAERLVQRFPNDAQARAAYALALSENERADEAAAEALRAVELAPDWSEAHAYLSLSYRAQARWRLAQEEARQAVELNPQSVDARRALALSLAFTGEFQIAIIQYEEAIKIHPFLDALYFELAPYYLAQENYGAAIQAYDRILAHDPRNVKAWTRKCETYFRDRDDVNAQASCEQAIDLDETFPEAHMQLGQVRYTRRNYEGAIESFERCISLMDAQGWPTDDRLELCYNLHGLAWYLLDDCSKAMPLFETAILVDSTERGREITLEGMRLCAQADETIDISDLPTPPPPTPVPPPPIDIY